MALPTKAQQWILNKKPTGVPTYEGPDATFVKKSDVDLPQLQDGQVLLQVLYLSNDPAQRAWIRKDIDPERLYTAPVLEGDIMRARTVAKVLDSKSKIAKGSLVAYTTGWVDYCVVDAAGCQPLKEIPGISMTHWLGSLGLTGLTAYYGLVDIAEAKPSDTVVISGAAGATGSMVVQIAKHIINCKKVIGIAGTDSKCKWVESLGADLCLNYKASDFEKKLTEATTPFADVYFDNTGGPILDFMLLRMAREGRIAACGSISSYNDEDIGLKNLFNVVSMRLKIKGFIVIDNLANSAKILEVFEQALRSGKIKVGDENETVVKGTFDDIPKTWTKLFSGDNQGKLITALE